jgi:hypothetical protein
VIIKSEIVLPKGSSDKQVRDAIKASALGGAANYKQSEPTNENKGAVGDRIFEKKKNNKS